MAEQAQEQQAFIVDGTLAETFAEACQDRGLLAPRMVEHLMENQLWTWGYQAQAARQTRRMQVSTPEDAAALMDRIQPVAKIEE